ncbi:hypothetical protein GCM10009802_15150 [Streptomyces synnematoformans]|uniref:AI-2E family transporter n=1 Tax=Streptomyces synnematoformans TaxID=415721 RepID=A0ABN2XR15_9ACTN
MPVQSRAQAVKRSYWITFLSVFAVAVVLSPFAVVYELVLGTVGLLISYPFFHAGSRLARRMVVVFAAIATGSLPYLALAVIVAA